MSVVSLNLPEDLEINDFEIKMIVASKLFEDGKVSSGQVAEIAGLSKRAFLEIVGK